MSNNWRDATFAALRRLGFDDQEASQLVRAAATLHTWAEHECNGTIQRDEESGVPYWYNTHTGAKIGRTSDRKRGALKRATKIAESRGFKVYHQGDPRGASLYLYRQADLDAFASRVYRPDQRNSAAIASCYSSIGTAIVP